MRERMTIDVKYLFSSKAYYNSCYKKELERFNRHKDFIEYMENNKDKNIDWDKYWTYYYTTEQNSHFASIRSRKSHASKF